MDKLLLHICCAPCGAYSYEYIKSLGYDVTLYFYNPNIYPKDEYTRRLDELKRFCKTSNIPLLIEMPDFNEFKEKIVGYENEPERGKRCEICYKMRLKQTVKKAKELNFDYFTTSLSISPHKSYEMITKISKELENQYGVKYLDVNLKKKDGYKKSVELSAKHGFYRQDYCGCKYSMRA